MQSYKEISSCSPELPFVDAAMARINTPLRALTTLALSLATLAASATTGDLDRWLTWRREQHRKPDAHLLSTTHSGLQP